MPCGIQVKDRKKNGFRWNVEDGQEKECRKEGEEIDKREKWATAALTHITK